jgi:exopolysaccharide biosynthesis polyprenyl glycosylphosphotransferase
MNKRRLTVLYFIFDLLAALFTWIIFFTYRKWHVDATLFDHFSQSIFHDYKFYVGLVIYPAIWLFLHVLSGTYQNISRKSRLKEFELTIALTLFGSICFFFSIILDDVILTYGDYLLYFAILFGCQYLFTYIPRVLITTYIVTGFHSGKWGYNTLIIGSDMVALNTYQAVIKQNPNQKKYILGYLTVPEETDHSLMAELPFLGEISELDTLIREKNIEELIIAIQNGKRKFIESIITLVRDNNGYDITLKIIPQNSDFVMGTLKFSAIFYEPLITISPEYMSTWQRFIKRCFDIFFSLLALILLSPVYLAFAIGVKSSSKGSVFYIQERIGFRGKPFHIIKFRSMIENAETDGIPQLSSQNDSRITRFGKFLRKTRMDELPQFYNVLIGDMSLVGPRPERKYYIEQITKIAPHYKLLLGVKPGITSWGQVKFGYAENVEEMVKRLKWDILYIENMSIHMDIKILIYTILIVLKRDGK